MQRSESRPPASRASLAVRVLLIAGALGVAAVMIWQAVTAAGTPDPTARQAGSLAAVVDIGVLVFREGLECVLVLAAVTASMVGASRTHRRPVAVGVVIALAASLLTWRAAVGILNDLTRYVPALHLQAATGLLAIIVLLIVMNWFFHKLYWTGWISLHTKRKKKLLAAAADDRRSRARLWWGLVLLGFTSVYREGVEVVLFLQSYRMKLGPLPVRRGVVIGLALSAVVAVLTFMAQHRLPYRKMLIGTGLLLGGVLLVMVGEQAQEMQLAGWMGATEIPGLVPLLRPWMGVWFGLFPTVESLLAQLAAAVLVIGSYVFVDLQLKRDLRKAQPPEGAATLLEQQPGLGATRVAAGMA